MATNCRERTPENKSVYKVCIHVYILFDEHQKLAHFAHKKHLSNMGSYSIYGFNGLWQFVHIYLEMPKHMQFTWMHSTRLPLFVSEVGYLRCVYTLDCWFKRMLNYVTLGFILTHIEDEERKPSEIAVNQCSGSIESISFHELNSSKKIIVCNQNWKLFNNFQNFIYICMLCKKLKNINFRK